MSPILVVFACAIAFLIVRYRFVRRFLFGSFLVFAFCFVIWIVAILNPG